MIARDEISFEYLFEDVLNIVFIRLSPEMLFIMALVSRTTRFAAIGNVVWSEKYKQHYNGLPKELFEKTNLNWHMQFYLKAELEYGSDRRIQNLFHIFNELVITNLDYKNLDAKKIKITDLEAVDKDKISLADYALRKKNQVCFDYMYKRVLIDITSQSNEIFPENFFDINAIAKSFDLNPTKIYWAVFFNQLEAVKELVSENSGLLMKTTKPKQSLIHLAVEKGHTRIVGYFIDQCNISVNQRREDDNLYTLLHLAIIYGHIEIVRLLLDREADLFCQTAMHHFVSIHLACREGHLDIVKVLLGVDPSLLNHPDKFAQTPLIWAAANGYLSIVAYLFEQGAFLEASTYGSPGGEGNTVLHWASKNGHTEVVLFLLKNGANRRSINQGGLMPFHLACEKGHLDIVKLFLDIDPSLLNTVDELKQTLLTWAAASGHDELVSFLVKVPGVDLHPITYSPLLLEDNGNTPLHWAIKNGHIKCMELLINNQANILALNKEGKTPVDLAKGTNDKFIAELRLRTYREKLEHCTNVDTKSNSSLGLFGYQNESRFSLKTNLAATKALCSVIFDEATPASLNIHKAGINTPELKNIFRELKLHYPCLQQVVLNKENRISTRETSKSYF